MVAKTTDSIGSGNVRRLNVDFLHYLDVDCDISSNNCCYHYLADMN